MTSRADIETGRLRYSCNCGWVDWGHAMPGGARRLWNQIQTESGSMVDMFRGTELRLNGHPAFFVWYLQSMGVSGMNVASAGRQFIVRKSLGSLRRKAVTLAIFQRVSTAFETMQGQLPWSVVSGASSFSVEDLISNMIGFYRAVEGHSEAQVKRWCGEVGRDASLAVYDAHLQGGIGAHKSRSFTSPRYYPCEECDEPGQFPSQLATISPATEGFDFVTVRGHIPGPQIRQGAILEFDNHGRHRARWR